MSLSIGDLVQLFFGRATTANQLRTPLQEFVRERALKGNQPTEENLDRAIDSVIHDLHPHLVLTAVSAFLYFYLIKFVFVKSYKSYPEYFLILRIFFLIFLFVILWLFIIWLGFSRWWHFISILTGRCTCAWRNWLCQYSSQLYSTSLTWHFQLSFESQ